MLPFSVNRRKTTAPSPVGGTDALPFARRGYHATAITCIDPEIGAPRNYHHPSDAPENLDVAQLIDSVDFIELAVREIYRAYSAN